MTFLELAAAWSIQIVLIGLGAEACAPLLRKAHPRVRALFWLATLVASLAAPWLMSRAPATAMAVPASVFLGASSAVERTLSAVAPTWQTAGGALWAGGVFLMLVRLGRGLHRLSSITRESRPIVIRDFPDLQVRESGSIQSPAASFLGRVILVPRNFLALPPTWRRAALVHEAIHLDRGHGILLVLEETVLALFWFHPMVFRLVRRVRDSREQMVDAATVEVSGEPRDYRDMLVGLAARIRIPAPAVSGTTALGARIESLMNLEETPMPVASAPRLLIAILALLGTAALASAAAPIRGTAEGVTQGGGKDAARPSRRVISKVAPAYPAALKEKKIEGVVQVAVTIDAKGAVTSATARPEDNPELSKAAIEALRQWRWEPGEGSVQYTQTIQFRLTRDGKK